MWKRFVKILCCPLCAHSLELDVFKADSVVVSDEHIRLAKEREIFALDFNHYVDAGLLLCHRCRVWFPIIHGLPVLVPYTTPIHDEFFRSFADRIMNLRIKYAFPSREPVRGEQFVMSSFSREWLEYDYDGVIWGMNYQDHERRFLSEVGVRPQSGGKATFLEIGCGLGITTRLAQKNYAADAVGIDLSLAVVKATQHYKTNPFLHFAQASVFHMPVIKEIADIVYSHGVLHHTYSTYEAFKAVAPHCRPGGLLYIWVYGLGSKKGSLLRRLAYGGETVLRPILSRHSSSPFSTLFLNGVACGYQIVNMFHYLRNPHTQRYNYKRALHAARDRFTPLYAHRQDYQEVSTWFQEAGFEDIQQVDWRTMPVADQDNYRRNTGIRGRRMANRQPSDREFPSRVLC
jgi:uncharacterized protein YbaR (Trm112 family)/SAM-dependent methyltransferase